MNPTFKTTEKIKLWGDTLFLFNKYKNFEGPFYRAGYSTIVLQATIMRNRNKFTSFDILATNDDDEKVCGIELTTCKEKDKDVQLQHYQDVTIDELREQVGVNVGGSINPILITNHEHNTNYAHIIMSEMITIDNLGKIADSNLRNYLDNINGKKIKSPQPKFTMDPEPNRFELRNGLIGQIMQLVNNGGSKTVSQFASEALDYLYELIDYDAKKELEKRIEDAMDDLVSNYLPSIIIKNDSSYFSKGKEGINRKYKTLSNELLNWVNKEKSPQSKLDKFIK